MNSQAEISNFFTNLPPEIRNSVYRHTLPSKNIILKSCRPMGAHHQNSLPWGKSDNVFTIHSFRVNKKFYDEASTHLFRHGKFTLQVYICEDDSIDDEDESDHFQSALAVANRSVGILRKLYQVHLDIMDTGRKFSLANVFVTPLRKILPKLDQLKIITAKWTRVESMHDDFQMAIGFTALRAKDTRVLDKSMLTKYECMLEQLQPLEEFKERHKHVHITVRPHRVVFLSVLVRLLIATQTASYSVSEAIADGIWLQQEVARIESIDSAFFVPLGRFTESLREKIGKED